MLELLSQVCDLLFIALNDVCSKTLFFSVGGCNLVELSAPLLEHLNSLYHPLSLLHRLALVALHLLQKGVNVLLDLRI